jgi:thioesterase domain-containing protein/acyl carrier protein
MNHTQSDTIRQQLAKLSPDQCDTLARKLGLKRSKNGDEVLVGYYVQQQSQELDPQELKGHMEAALPSFMVPSLFVKLDAFPLTANGKIDRDALPAPGLDAGPAFVPPQGRVEEILVRIWEEVLELPTGTVGTGHNFFELGGHSLKATIMVSKMFHEFNVRVPLAEIFKLPTVAQLALYIEDMSPEAREGTGETSDNLVLLSPASETGDEAKNLFLLHDGTGEVEAYIELARQLGRKYRCWAVRADRLPSAAPQIVDFHQLAAGYGEKITTLQPQGPYYICGWSLGGVIAFEVVRALEQAGQRVAALMAIDPPAPYDSPTTNGRRFTLEEEKAYIHQFAPSERIKAAVANQENTPALWAAVCERLDEEAVDPAVIRNLFPQHMDRLLPHFESLSAKDLVYYLNVARTFYRAMETYAPSGTVSCPTHFFTTGKESSKWGGRCAATVTYHPLAGDHYSIMQTEAPLRALVRAIGDIIL